MVGVKRKRKNYRQFFLSGISKDVNDSQIASQHKDNMKPVVPGSNYNRQGRNYATNV